MDRSREMYDKRVKPEVAQRYDYFHTELVRPLPKATSEAGSAYPEQRSRHKSSFRFLVRVSGFGFELNIAPDASTRA